MKKSTIIIVAIIVIAIIIIAIISSNGRYKYLEKYDGTEATLIENYNFRSEPEINDDNVICQLPKGEKLILTGNIYKVSEDDLWFEVKTPEGETGWVFKGGLFFRK